MDIPILNLWKDHIYKNYFIKVLENVTIGIDMRWLTCSCKDYRNYWSCIIKCTINAGTATRFVVSRYGTANIKHILMWFKWKIIYRQQYAYLMKIIKSYLIQLIKLNRLKM